MKINVPLAAAAAALVVALSAGAVAWAVASGSESGDNGELPPDKASMLASESALDQSLVDRDKNTSASASIDAAKSSAAEQHSSDVANGAESSEPATPDLGISSDVEAPFATSVFQATSHWGGYVGQQGYVVYAGANGQDASQGELVVDPYTAGSGDTSPPTFHRLDGVGALTIVGANDAVLTLVDSRGDKHLFDVASGSFE